MVDFEQDIEQCLRVLREGGLILYPTDTVWGIGCDATNEQAVQRIYEVKKRPDEKAMIVLVAEEKNVMQCVAAVDLGVFDYLEQSTKPTTVIYKGAIGLATNLTGTDGSVAVRICKDEFCKHLLKRFRKPIVSTSANISGQPSAPVFSAIADEIKSAVDYVVKHRQDDNTIAEPSTVIKWKDGEVVVLRP
jgi:L-threonylcarbamoyladenylate synthase